jgi:ATP-dependent DNA helicase Rep
MEADEPLDAQVRWNVVQSLIEAAERQDGKGADALLAFLERLALDNRPDDEKKDDGPKGVSLLTVHAAKGLEFPHVFIVGVEETLFPHKNAVEDEDNLDGVDEERRLFYVAATRARETLLLSLAKQRRRYGRDEERERSRFLEEMDADDDLEWLNAATEGPAEEAVVNSFLSRLKGLVAEDE